MRRGYAVLVVPLVAGALALVWWAPWSSGPDVIARARAAFGTEPVVHVVGRNAPGVRVLVRNSGVEVWYEPSARRAHVVTRHNGTVVGDLVAVVPVGVNVDAIASPATLADFVTHYRPNLVRRSFRVGRTERIQGRRVLWLRSPTLEVALDPVSYQPVWISAPGTARLIQLVVAETVPLDPVDFQTQRQKKPRHL